MPGVAGRFMVREATLPAARPSLRAQVRGRGRANPIPNPNPNPNPNSHPSPNSNPDPDPDPTSSLRAQTARGGRRAELAASPRVCERPASIIASPRRPKSPARHHLRPADLPPPLDLR